MKLNQNTVRSTEEVPSHREIAGGAGAQSVEVFTRRDMILKSLIIAGGGALASVLPSEVFAGVTRFYNEFSSGRYHSRSDKKRKKVENKYDSFLDKDGVIHVHDIVVELEDMGIPIEDIQLNGMPFVSGNITRTHVVDLRFSCEDRDFFIYINTGTPGKYLAYVCVDYNDEGGGLFYNVDESKGVFTFNIQDILSDVISDEISYARE